MERHVLEYAQLDRDMLRRLARERVMLNQKQMDLNERIKTASGGRLHNNGCDLGGLVTGMQANVSGEICWCGYSDLKDKD